MAAQTICERLPDRSAFLALLPEKGAVDRTALLDWLARHDSLAYAQAQAQFYSQQAQAELATLPDSPAKFALAALAEFSVARNG